MSDDDDFISLAQLRSTPSLLDQLRAQMAVGIARQIDDAVIGALHRRGLTLDEARPRMTRQVMGGMEHYLLDGQVFVEIGPRRCNVSDDGRGWTATVDVKEVPEL